MTSGQQSSVQLYSLYYCQFVRGRLCTELEKGCHRTHTTHWWGRCIFFCGTITPLSEYLANKHSCRSFHKVYWYRLIRINTTQLHCLSSCLVDVISGQNFHHDCRILISKGTPRISAIRYWIPSMFCCCCVYQSIRSSASTCCQYYPLFLLLHCVLYLCHMIDCCIVYYLICPR